MSPIVHVSSGQSRSITRPMVFSMGLSSFRCKFPLSKSGLRERPDIPEILIIPCLKQEARQELAAKGSVCGFSVYLSF